MTTQHGDYIPHDHPVYIPDCFRCVLSRDEASEYEDDLDLAARKAVARRRRPAWADE